MKYKNIPEKVVRFVISCNDEELRDMTVSSIARRLDVDRSHLSRQFKRGMNFTLAQFIKNERLIRAAFHLRRANKITLSQLAERVGFSSSEYFSQVFKQYFGVLPSKYREYQGGRNY